MKLFDDSETPTLASALSERMNGEDLKALAALTGEKLPVRKADLAAVIVRHLKGDRLHAVWEGLDELQRAAVAEVVHADSDRFDVSRFRAKYGKDPDWGVQDDAASWRRQKPSALCFFFVESVMPADLKTRLKAFVPAPRPEAISASDQLPAACGWPPESWTAVREDPNSPVPLIAWETERAAERELFSVLRAVDARKVSVSEKTRRPSSATIDAITELLVGGEYYNSCETDSDDEIAGPIRAFAWPLLIQAGGLAQLSGTRLQLTKAGRKALSDPAAATLRTLWKKWLSTTMFDELARIECVKGQNGKGKRGLTAASSRRESIAISLAECPPGKWIATDEFIRHIEATGNEFEVTRNPWDLYICEPQNGALGYEGYTAVLNDRYVMALLLEYAATLGLIDVALIPPAEARHDFRDIWGTDDLPYFSRYDGLMHFRITPFGAWCLDMECDYRPAPREAKPVLRVLPNQEIEATLSELEASDRLALNAWAAPVSDSVWKLEIGKLLAAVEAGRSLEELRDFLTTRSAADLPDEIVRLLDDAAGRCTKVYDRGLARLIECADSALADLIASHPRLSKHCIRTGERHLVVPAASEAAFRRTLRAIGYLLAAVR